jgi:formylglycine-generating enzyme required for sulfatase activity
MLLVAGEYCPGLAEPCLHWVKGGVMRCAQFAPSTCIGKREQRRFCIDRYEYPNLAGVKPVVMVSWYDALRACDIEGKRLCLVSEWNMACEGTERLPYPYGHKRNKHVCNFERPRPQPEPHFNLFAKPRAVGAEVARLDLRVESGRLEGCVSPYGVHDMTGNVDEWTLNEDHFDLPEKKEGKPRFISGLKGGYWGPIRAACRPITPTHEEIFRFYQVGFRCCANAKDKPDGVADRYTSRLKKWRETAGLPEHPPSPKP